MRSYWFSLHASALSNRVRIRADAGITRFCALLTRYQNQRIGIDAAIELRQRIGLFHPAIKAGTPPTGIAVPPGRRSTRWIWYALSVASVFTTSSRDIRPNLQQLRDDRGVVDVGHEGIAPHPDGCARRPEAVTCRLACAGGDKIERFSMYGAVSAVYSSVRSTCAVTKAFSSWCQRPSGVRTYEGKAPLAVCRCNKQPSGVEGGGEGATFIATSVKRSFCGLNVQLMAQRPCLSTERPSTLNCSGMCLSSNDCSNGMAHACCASSLLSASGTRVLLPKNAVRR